MTNKIIFAQKKSSLLFYIILIFLLKSFGVSAQNSDSLPLVYYYDATQGMQFKWLPFNYETFVLGFKNGYNLYRAEAVPTAAGGEKLTEFIKINSSPIKCWSSEKLKLEMPKDSNLSAAGIFIEGASELINPEPATNMEEAVEKRKGEDLLSFIASFIAITSNNVAEAIGLYIKDQTYNPQKKYVYKLEIAEREDIKSIIIVYPYTVESKEKVMGLTAELRTEHIFLSWFNNNNQSFPYFNIYRSTNEKKNFVKLNSVPYTGDFGDAVQKQEVTTFIDSFPEYNKTYYYKVVGINAFEAEGTPSETIKIDAKYLLKSRPRISGILTLDSTDVKLDWEVMPDDAPYIKGFTVKRASSGPGPYKNISGGMLTGKKYSFVDRSSKSSSNYYVVCAYGMAGDSSCSLLRAHLLIDSIPPSVPEVVYGNCDTNGIITLRWNKPPEDDLLGYRVFRTYHKNFEPKRLYAGHISDTFLIDTISMKMAYNEIYYSISAIDFMTNPSAPSALFKVKIPDFKPPTNGYLKTIKSSKDGILITWNNSNAYDLKAMHLLRKQSGFSLFDTILTTTGDSTSVTQLLDTATKTGITYTYTLIAEDEAGLYSDYARELSATQLRKEEIPFVTNLQTFPDKGTRMIKLTWDFPQLATGFKIFRSRNGEKLDIYTFVDGNLREFYDKQLTPKSKYKYLIVAELPGGYVSGYSNTAEVAY